MKPNIATRASRRVPFKFSSVVPAMSTMAMMVVARGVLSTPNSCARNGAIPVANPGPHPRHRPAQRPAIHPPGHPCPALTDETARPGIDSSGNRKLRDDFAEHEAYHELSQSDADIGPPHRRAADHIGGRKQRVDADHRRQIREDQGENLPLSHSL